jgi:hypothetical protein
MRTLDTMSGDEGEGDRPPVDEREARRVGLCARCTNARRITSGKGSTFWMCRAPGLPKYPPLPVTTCRSFSALATLATIVLAIAGAAVLTACSGGPGAGSSAQPRSSAPPTTTTATTTTPAAEPGPAPSPPSSPPDPGAVVGKWSSPSCGERKYERWLDLEAGGRFTADDRVSPCPPGARCVWSGIVHREGTWKVEGGRVALSVGGDEKTPRGAPFPTSLAAAGGKLAEDGGGARCEYTRR